MKYDHCNRDKKLVICVNYFQGWQVLYSEVLEKDWKEKHDDWLKRFKGLFFFAVV